MNLVLAWVPVDLPILVTILFAIPVAYLVISYGYLASWHRKPFLWDTLIHENGRLTLCGSLFYFDHFVACVPMVLLFALCAAGGFVLRGHVTSDIDASLAGSVAIILLLASALFVLLASVASIYKVGWQRTIDYASQRIERDGIMSKGGNWNQLQLSNLPIALGTVGVSSAFLMVVKGFDSKGNVNLIVGGMSYISVAAVLSVGISTLNWCGWQRFLNPRWMAHGIREIATYPLTGIPIALASILLVEYHLSGVNTWTVEPHSWMLILIGTGIAMAIAQLILLRKVDISGIAQKPPFAPNGLSIPYLLCAHVFEHFLDFVLIGPLTGGMYALVRFLAL